MKKILFFLFTVLLAYGCSNTEDPNKTVNVKVSIIHGPYLQAVGENQAVIVWTTDKNAVSWVEIASAGTDNFETASKVRYFEMSNGKRISGVVHSILVDNLRKGTEYRYRVSSKAFVSDKVFGDSIIDTPNRFKTFDAQKDTVSFSVVNDIHGNNSWLEFLLKGISYGNTDMVFFNGDMVSSAAYSEGQIFADFMTTAVSMWAKEVPTFFVRGNHECRNIWSSTMWNGKYFPTVSGHRYYAFRQGPVFFLVLDSGEDGTEEASQIPNYDAERAEQTAWLQNSGVLQSEACTTASFRVVLTHIGVFTSAAEVGKAIGMQWSPLLNAANFTLMLAGHKHEYRYFPTIEVQSFPLLVNANNTSVEVHANKKKMTVYNKDLNGNILNQFSYTAQ